MEDSNQESLVWSNDRHKSAATPECEAWAAWDKSVEFVHSGNLCVCSYSFSIYVTTFLPHHNLTSDYAHIVGLKMQQGGGGEANRQAGRQAGLARPRQAQKKSNIAAK